jgi:hypothetical protein
VLFKVEAGFAGQVADVFEVASREVIDADHGMALA